MFYWLFCKFGFSVIYYFKKGYTERKIKAIQMNNIIKKINLMFLLLKVLYFPQILFFVCLFCL